MPGMRDQFAHFYMPDDDAIATAMTNGLVVPDTNVVLSLYRFQATARDELFEELEKLGSSERLWIPYQVGHEFHRNRLEAIAQQEQFFRETRRELDGSIGAVRRRVQAFQARLALSKDDLREIADSIEALQKLIQREVAKAEKANEVRLKDRDSDKVLARLEKLFDNRVGSSMEPGELEEARVEAERRGREKIPPGYKDADKDKGDPAGDYLIWRQLMTEAKTRKLPVVFITDDTKEDWYRREHDVPLGARYELREEIMREAGVPLLMMTTETFIRHARKYLNAKFSEETVKQAKELPSVARPEDLFATVRTFRHPLTFTRRSDESDWLLERITTGTVRNRMELSLNLRLMRTELGSTEMALRVVQAVTAGQQSGLLEQEAASAVLNALAEELRLDSNMTPFHAVNPGLPVLRDDFERALGVSPESDDPDSVAQARRIIAMNMERHQATDNDRERARAWLQEHDEWLNAQRSESQDELSVEDL